MPEVLILGAGMVGRVMAADLAADADFAVTVTDFNEDALQLVRQSSKSSIRTIHADLSDAVTIRNLVEKYDLVLGALPGSMGFAALRAVIEAGRNYCDISFMPEDAWMLDELAKKHGVTAVFDCGIAPGISNLLAGYAANELEACESIAIYVGGVPRNPKPPLYYKAAFSFVDVIEEYTRPARLVENEKIVFREALSEPEYLTFQEVGELEAFNTDGLRSLTALNVPNMKEKTLRHKPHIQLMRTLRDIGLFDTSVMQFGESAVRPVDVISRLIFPKWRYEPGEEDITVLRVIAEGQREGEHIRMVWDISDSYDTKTQTSSMAHTTALPCTIVARKIASGEINHPGVIAPEYLGRIQGMARDILDKLMQRGITCNARIEND